MKRTALALALALGLLSTVTTTSWGHPAGSSCSQYDGPLCVCIPAGKTGMECTLASHPHPHEDGDHDDPPPPDDDDGESGGTTGQPVSTRPQRVCSLLRTEETGDHHMDGSAWAIGRFRCEPDGTEYTELVCIMACPAGYVEPPPPPLPPEPGDPAPPPMTPEQLLYVAYADLPPSAPPMQVEPETPVVGVSTFLHVPDLEARASTASDGPISVTVTATPVGVLWQFGEHEWSCPSGGAPYSPDRLDDSMAAGALVAEPDLCTFLFEDSSADAQGGPYPSSVRTVWDYSWSVNGVDQGIFNAGFASPPSNFDLEVREIQAVLTNE